jgi:hypothetical protein
MIDMSNEHLITLSRAARIVNPSDQPHIATIWRWVLYGVRGQRLESVIIGGRRYTSEEAIQRFLFALNKPGAVPAPVSAAAIAAGKRLEAMGA